MGAGGVPGAEELRHFGVAAEQLGEKVVGRREVSMSSGAMLWMR